jgi:hypothetical protein
MKTFFKSFFKFIQSIFLQVLLCLVALVAFDECSSNYNNVAMCIAMCIICSVCIIMITWLEINKKPKL